jgi:hypothetical protein
MCVLALVAVAAQGAGGGPESPGALVVGFDWKYEGYAQVEIVDGGKSGTSTRVKRRKAYVFKYRARVHLKNGGAKAVKAVNWDYVFAEPETGRELRRYRVESRRHILPGETQSLDKEIYVEPKENTRHLGTGRQSVLVTRVEFADGTVWRADEGRP